MKTGCLSDYLFCIVTGMEHSGTTFLAEKLKASLPHIGGAFECGLLLAETPDEFSKFDPFYNWFCKPHKIGHWGLSAAQRESICSAKKWPECYRRLANEASFLPEGSLILDKTPRYVYHLPDIAARSESVPILISTKDIFLQYHSFKKRGYSIQRFLKLYQKNVESIEEIKNMDEVARRVKIIPQAEMAMHPEKVITDALSFIANCRNEKTPLITNYSSQLPTNLGAISKSYSAEKEIANAKASLTPKELDILEAYNATPY